MDAKIIVKIYPENAELCGQCQFISPIRDVEKVSFCTAFGLPLCQDSAKWSIRCDECRKQSEDIAVFENFVGRPIEKQIDRG